MSTRNELLERLRAKRSSYHLEHPFEEQLRNGKLSRRQLQFWVANRFYYQVMIPRKDAAIIANCPDSRVRRAWAKRLADHDGYGDETGGIEAWIGFGEACGLTRREMLAFDHLVPGVKFAVDAYYNFAREATWQEAICSSLTELFASDAHRSRIEAFSTHYQWLPTSSFSYFEKRLDQVKRDVDHGLSVTLEYFDSPERHDRALEILEFKLDILWTMADNIFHHEEFARRADG